MAVHVAARIFPNRPRCGLLSMSLLVLDYIILSPNFYGSFFFGKITIVLYFVIQTVFLSGSRIAYRYLHDANAAKRPQRLCLTDVDSTCSRRRCFLARDRKRRHQENLASGPAVTCGS
jgi:hypothetical protein